MNFFSLMILFLMFLIPAFYRRTHKSPLYTHKYYTLEYILDRNTKTNIFLVHFHLWPKNAKNGLTNPYFMKKWCQTPNTKKGSFSCIFAHDGTFPRPEFTNIINMFYGLTKPFYCIV